MSDPSIILCDDYNLTHSSRINKNTVYISTTDCVIFAVDTLNTLNTSLQKHCNNIVNPEFATYTTNILKVTNIVNKYDINDTVNEYVDILELCTLKKYIIGKTIEDKHSKLLYYKSPIVAHYNGINKHNYTGFYKSWYDNGVQSEEGYYMNGNKTGLWKYTMLTNNGEYINTERTYENGNTMILQNSTFHERLLPYVNPMQYTLISELFKLFEPINSAIYNYWRS